jgi:effector-binding domain-containing protein
VAYEIEARTLEKHNVAAVRFRSKVADMGQHMGAAFGSVMEYLTRNNIPPEGPAVSHYVPVAEGEFDVAAGFLVAGPIDGDGHVVPVELPAGEVAVTTHVGPYDDLPKAYEAIQAWISAEGREPDVAMWEEYVTGPETPPQQTRTIIYWLLKPRDA